MFMLAHLSDLHLASPPRLTELTGKRGLGFINWHRGRKYIHRADVLDAITRDLKDSRRSTTSRSPAISSISRCRPNTRARGVAADARLPRDVTVVPGNHDIYVPRREQCRPSIWGDYMRGDDGARSLSVPAAARSCCADRAVDRRCRRRRSWRPAGSAKSSLPASPRRSIRRADCSASCSSITRR